MGLSRTVSKIDGDFSRKSQNFPTPLVFCAPDEGFPLELGTGAGSQKTRMMGLPGRQRSLTISSAVWIQCTNVTDGRTPRATAKTALTYSVARYKGARGVSGYGRWIATVLSFTKQVLTVASSNIDWQYITVSWSSHTEKLCFCKGIKSLGPFTNLLTHA